MSTKQLYSMDDLYAKRYQSVLRDLGIENVLASLEAFGAELVADVNTMLDELSEETVRSSELWGGVPSMSFERLGEFAVPDSQRDVKDQLMQFPLSKLGAAVIASREAMKRATGAEARQWMLAMEQGYYKRIRDELKRCIFGSARRQWSDSIYPQDGILDKIKPFINADGETIPDSPNGTSFTAASHQHYVGTSGTTVSTYDINTLLGNVREHFTSDVDVVLFTDATMPATLAAVTDSKFLYNQYVNVVAKNTADIGSLANLGAGNRENISIGVWDGSPVITRSWVPTGYIAAIAINAPEKPIKRRVDPMFQGMFLEEVLDRVLKGTQAYTYMGFGVFNRAAGACLDTTHQTNYTDPTGLLTD